MIEALVNKPKGCSRRHKAVENPSRGVRIVEVTDIRRGL